MPELLGERARMQRPGAAVRDERELARIVPTLDRDDAQRAQHLRVHDLDHRSRIDPGERALRRPRDRATSPPGSSAGNRPSRRFASVTVGAAASPVTRRAWIRAGRLRSDPHRAAGVAPHERAAAGADRVHVDRRQPDRAGRRPRARRTRAARPPGRRQTSVEVPPMSNAIACSKPARRATSPAPTTPPAGPETSSRRRMRRRLFDREHAAGGEHHDRLRQPRLGRRARERAQVARRDRREIGVGGGRRGALVLAELGRDLVRRDDVHAGMAPPQLAPRPPARATASRNAKSRHTATASASPTSGSEPSSSGSSSPSGPSRPRTP